MHNLYTAAFEPGFFGSAQVHTAVAVGGLVAIVSAVTGVFTVLRGQSFGGHALGDVSAAGGSAAVLAGLSPVAGFVGLGIVGAGVMDMIGVRRLRGRDLATGIVLGSAIGLSALFLHFTTTSSATTGSVQQILFGSIFVTSSDTVLAVIVLGAVALASIAAVCRPLLLSTVSPEIAAARGVPAGRTVVSPPSHSAFHTPTELMEFIATLRRLSGGKPVGFKLCVGARTEFLSVCKAMLATGITPDFIIVDGSEGGTGAAPQEFEDHVGMPLTAGLMLVHNALVGTGLRDRIRVGASGKVASGVDIVSRICQGADFTLAARAMMFAVGCIQARACHTNRCPTGVATQDPGRAHALDVPNKAGRVYNFQRATVASAAQIVASMGLDGFHQLSPAMLNRRVDGQHSFSYAEIYQWLAPGELLTHPPESWRADWAVSRADAFA